MTRIVVLIDDDQDDLDLFQDAIKAYDASTICIPFTTGTEALRALDALSYAPDFILTDLNMPILSGDQIVTELRKNGSFNSTIIAVVSTSDLKPKEQALKNLGANYIFRKPNTFSGYAKILNQLFTRSIEGV